MWADNFPEAQALYDPELEKDSCGVGFIASIKGQASHQILHDASYLLCNMAHRGAEGADIRDGDGAGVMTSLPHQFFLQTLNVQLPEQGRYACGNIYLHPDSAIRSRTKETFERLATQHGLSVQFWRDVPRDNSMIGPMALSKEPVIEQPFITFAAQSQQSQPNQQFDFKKFDTALYLLRKHSTHNIGSQSWFYICSLSRSTIVYKGRLSPSQVYTYFLDLKSPLYETHFALVHSRFSTNTFPSWDRAQPLRFCAHNGEINTLRGNKNWNRAREGQMSSSQFGKSIDRLFPIVEEFGSDSSSFDNVLELLVVNGQLSLPEAVMAMIPEAWQNQKNIAAEKRAFYEWASCVMEPWDGPALITFSDGRFIGACLDRNGLRPCRFYVTDDDRMICASEVGCLKLSPEIVVAKGRLEPGKMLLIDTKRGVVVDDHELKWETCTRLPFVEWTRDHIIRSQQLMDFHRSHPPARSRILDSTPLNEDPRMKAFGFTLEHLNMLILPMAQDGKEALGSMGTDTPLACLSQLPRPVFDYFKQLFAQVTNPPIDPIREEIVMSLACYIGPEGNLLDMSASQCDRLHLPSPILSIEEVEALCRVEETHSSWRVGYVDITFPKHEGISAYVFALDRVCAQVSLLIDQGYKLAVLTDRSVSSERVSLSSLIALGAAHHHLIMNKQRTKISLIVETAEAREVHHMCVLLGYGADAICPYLTIEAIQKLKRDGIFAEEVSAQQMIKNYVKACNNGILKVMSKMGISTLQSYKGAQIFECLGLSASVVQKCFAGTASRIKGCGFSVLARDAFILHQMAYPSLNSPFEPGLTETGEMHWRAGGEEHLNDPFTMARLQVAVRDKNERAYAEYSRQCFEQQRQCTLRGMLTFKKAGVLSVPLEEVEPWTNIVKRFCTGAMSYGSISWEAHSTLAKAMNQLGGKSNTGEGGDPNLDEQLVQQLNASSSGAQKSGSGNKYSTRAAIKQVASGRFGVTSYYLSTADDIQIKMAQGAKPGEGGELPGHKVSAGIAKTRKSTQGVGLISPPPHHDIYSIEDLKQLIYDLKCANPKSRVSVKLVSEVGVGVIAAGVAKAKADHILISGHDGGTGASRWTGIKHAGLPWELGLAETHQTLVMNGLRSRVTIQTDGQIKTGRDIAIACLLGSEEWGFATTPLIALGCVMMRKCHLNTCPVGIATQDPALRAKFEGQPEHVINFFYYLAEEMREIMAQLGFRSVNEMVGRADMLIVNDSLRTPKTQNLDLLPIIAPASSLRSPATAISGTAASGTAIADKQHQQQQQQLNYKSIEQDHQLSERLDNKLIEMARPVLKQGQSSVQLQTHVINTDRSVGTTLSYHVSSLFGERGLADGAIKVQLQGSAGQSFGAFLAPGVELWLDGDANDYVGKGLSGGRIIVRPPPGSSQPLVDASEANVIVGNVCLYGATSGEAYFRGQAAERFCVRNSGALAVVEGVGDHGCEYMTGGSVVILGQTGRNFAAGMSGGVAYILVATSSDLQEALEKRKTFAELSCNLEMVDLEPQLELEDISLLQQMLERHAKYTDSAIARRLLSNWSAEEANRCFLKVFPKDLKEQLKLKAIKEQQEQSLESTLAQSDVAEQENIKDQQQQQQQLKQEQMKLKESGGGAASKDIEDLMSGGGVKKEPLDKLKGFMKYKRSTDPYRDPVKRVSDWDEINRRLPVPELRVQAARCMDCGVPFCQSTVTGCPIGNIIPKWNELVFKQQWRDAFHRLAMTNNFPEFTGRVCPAPCEGSCVLGISESPVAIKSIECAIIDRAFDEGWLQPRPPKRRLGKRIAIVGSGPAGLAAADQLNKVGYIVTVYERNDRIGGLLMYGIPNMKLDKRIVQRRVDLLAAEGVKFMPGSNVGQNVPVRKLQKENEVILLATGATWPRDLNIPNRSLNGIHFAMEFLEKNTKTLLDNLQSANTLLNAKGKRVVVIGGGDTGCDCIGTSVRHGAKSIVNFELLPQPPGDRAHENPWPEFPRVFKVDYGHAEVKAIHGKDPRQYCVLSKSFVSDGKGNVAGINTVRVEWTRDANGRWKMVEIPGSEELFEADLVLLALGFLGPEHALLKQLDVEIDAKSNIIKTGGTSKYRTNVDGIFAAGDCRRGQSLIVWGINEGRQAAREIDNFLMGTSKSLLPVSGGITKLELELSETLVQIR